jgi:hypothetical protein
MPHEKILPYNGTFSVGSQKGLIPCPALDRNIPLARKLLQYTISITKTELYEKNSRSTGYCLFYAVLQ